MLLRIEDIVSGIKKDRNQGGRKANDDEDNGEDDTFGDNRDG